MRFLLLLWLPAIAAAPAAASGPMGDWVTPTGSIVRVEPCAPNSGSAPAACLKIVQLSASAPETTDRQNPDASLRARPLCGLVIGSGFQQEDSTHLRDGHLYDPRSGHTYHGAISSAGDNLKLHGYIGAPMFGRTETWHRSPPVTACH